MNLCRFSMTTATLPSGSQLFYPVCGCGWIGNPAIFTMAPIPEPKDLEIVGRRWEHHRVTFAAQGIAAGRRRAFI